MKKQIHITNAKRPDGHQSIELKLVLTSEDGNDSLSNASFSVFLGNENWTMLAAQEAALSEVLKQLQHELDLVRMAIEWEKEMQSTAQKPTAE